MSNNPVYYWELASHDAEKSVEFFKRIFGWDFQHDENVGLYEVPSGNAAKEFAGGGIFTLRKAKLPFLTIYIKVEDIEAKARLIEREGGFIVIEPFMLDSGSKICLFNEPSGVTFAMIEPGKKD